MTDDARLMRKVDWHIFPICYLAYLANFLDRTKCVSLRVVNETDRAASAMQSCTG